MAIVAVTGWGQDDDRRRTREAGFDGHFVKPLDLGTLTELISSITAKASLSSLCQKSRGSGRSE